MGQVIRFRPPWKLDGGYKIADRPLQGSRDSGDVDPERQRDNWDGRHYLTTSRVNEHLHDNDREYFGRLLKKRSERVLQPIRKGITRHYKPIAARGNPDGRDEDIKPSEQHLINPSAMGLSRRSHGQLRPLSQVATSNVSSDVGPPLHEPTSLGGESQADDG